MPPKTPKSRNCEQVTDALQTVLEDADPLWDHLDVATFDTLVGKLEALIDEAREIQEQEESEAEDSNEISFGTAEVEEEDEDEAEAKKPPKPTTGKSPK